MSGSKQVQWRSGLASGIPTRHQPLWSWLAPKPFTEGPRFMLGPLAGLTIWLVGLSALGWMLLWIKAPKKITIVQFVAGYQTNLLVPQNYPGVRCGELIQGLEGTHLASSDVKILPPLEFRQETDIGRAIGDIDSPILVLNFFMLGSTDKDGPFLLTDDADSAAGRTKLIRVSQILEFLKKQPEKQVKLLIFDSEHQEALWNFGILENYFSEGIKSLEKSFAEVPNLVVVSSCEPGQFSWRYHQVGLTNFGNQLVRCLSGIGKDFNKDGEIDLDEVIRNLELNVSQWAGIFQGTKQTILVYPREESERARLLGAGRVAQAGGQGFQPPPLGLMSGASELREAWERRKKLLDGNQSPETFCPDLWEVYQRTLLRYESLLRVGDSSSALTLREMLRKVESRVQSAIQLPLESSANSLWLGAIAGEAGVEEQGVATIASDLLSVPETEVETRLESFLNEKKETSPGRSGLHLSLIRNVLQQAATSPKPDTVRLARVLRLLDSPGRLRPVEAQGVLLHLRDRPETQSSESTLPEFIKVRLLAEQASCGLSRQGPWIQSPERGALFQAERIHRADRIRQLAQDRLLSTNQEVRSAAVRALAEVSEQYKSIAEDSVRISQWMNRFDHFFSILPYYTYWAAKVGGNLDPTDPETASEIELALVKAWGHIHNAASAKEDAARLLSSGGDFSGALQRFETETGLAQELYEKVKSTHQRRCEVLATANIFGQDQFIEDALNVPEIDVFLRMKMIEARTTQTTRGELSSIPEGSANPDSKRMDQADFSARKGRLGMAVLGARLFDDKAIVDIPDLLEFSECQDKLRAYQAQPDGGSAFLLEVGHQIHLRFSRFQKYSDDLVLSSRIVEPSLRLSILVKADTIDRLAGLDNEEIPPAGSELRRTWVNLFLVQEAKRAWTEHLYNIQEGFEPYFARSMDLFLADASTGPKPTGLDEVVSLRKLRGELDLHRIGLDESGVRKKLSEAIPWTTEESIRLEVEVGPVPDGKLPPGHVELLVEPGEGIGRPATLSGERRKVELVEDKPGEGAKPDNSLLVDLVSPIVANGQDPAVRIDPAKFPSSLTITAIFRGQRVRLIQPLHLYKSAPLIHSNLTPSGPSTLAIRADQRAVEENGQAKGNIAILVDCSGSMGPTERDPGKIVQVAQALEQVISKLPPGVNFSVWVFGQAEGPGRTVDNPEDTIRVIAGPSVLGSQPKEVAKRLADKFRNGELIPWNKSPVVAAMAKAGKLLTGPGMQNGPSTMLVLTDGKDNRAGSDKSLNPEKLPVPVLLAKLFEGTGIQIRVIGFKAGDEDDGARADFDSLSKLNPPGGYSSAGDLDTLIAQMERSLRREFRFQLENRQNLPAPGMPDNGFPASLPGFNRRWINPGIPPGEYLIRSGPTRPPLGVARLGSGDCLYLSVNSDGKLSRLGELADIPSRPTAKSGNWAIGLAQNRLEGDGAKRMGFLEKAWDPAEIEFAQINPGIVWWECPPNEPLSSTLRVCNEQGYASPAWSLDSPWWPKSRQTEAPAKAALKAWWLPDLIRPFTAEFTKGSDFQLITDLVNKPMLVDGRPCLLESVRVETRKVCVGNGRYEKVSALVVRTRTSPAKGGEEQAGLPIGSLDGFPLRGQEQIVHAEAGKVAAVFWPVDASSLPSIKSIQFRSIKAIKDAALQTGRHISIPDIPSPDPNDQRPRPALPESTAKASLPSGEVNLP